MSKGEEKREAILKAALHVFSEHGYDRSTVQQIAEKANVGKGTVYGYFTSKSEIFGDVIKWGFTHVSQAFLDILHKNESPFLNKLYRIYKTNQAMFENQKELQNIMLNDLGKVPADIKDWGERLEHELVQVLELQVVEAIEKEEIIKIDPRVFSYSFLSSLNVTYRYEPKGEETLDDVIDEQYRMLCNAIERKES
ncbi:TetR/AcrR family transcriptional regulator [Texcoconibacillus texcoconensis]|uniref:TetR/AcrR family fatty acid metabolism transcriptional regulator n=1 Tax=Texcoconibacillus texcoconensis TaxID=1095777 RepID=A0A840QQ41_9BACI|nr:TetR/AcrR family transcriptional regulator [Texcoconibacillus texcoconensis]MBB5173494.1 TetR/AcrR family fatty acid metabolism transcriptional regulator [Texcoconibacillus texcoconensis]